MNMSVVRVDTLMWSLTRACELNADDLGEKKRSRECRLAKCDVRFVGKRQAHSKLFN